MRRRKRGQLFLIAFAVFFSLGLIPCYGASAVRETADITDMTGDLDQYNFEDIQKYLDQSGQAGSGFSFTSLMKDLLAGNFSEVLGTIGSSVKATLFSEMENSGKMMSQVLVLGIIGAVFTNFSSIFTSSQISETGFFVTYLLLFTMLAASFFSSIQVASSVLSNIMEFMQALVPSYFLAVAFAGGSLTSVASYEFTLLVITVIQGLFFKILLPMVRVYVLLVLAGHIAKEDVLSKMTDLLKTAIQWSLKTLLGVVLGFHLIQGMVLPYVDSMKNNSVQKLIEIIPGIGHGAGAIAQMVMGSGVLIKNTIGAAAVIILLIITLIPLCKLLFLMILYHCAAAIMQPICDKRIVSCISSVAQGHKLLLSIVIAALMLFILSIAVICASTNVTYYAG